MKSIMKQNEIDFKRILTTSQPKSRLRRYFITSPCCQNSDVANCASFCGNSRFITQVGQNNILHSAGIYEADQGFLRSDDRFGQT